MPTDSFLLSHSHSQAPFLFTEVHTFLAALPLPPCHISLWHFADHLPYLSRFGSLLVNLTFILKTNLINITCGKDTYFYPITFVLVLYWTRCLTALCYNLFICKIIILWQSKIATNSIILIPWRDGIYIFSSLIWADFDFDQ